MAHETEAQVSSTDDAAEGEERLGRGARTLAKVISLNSNSRIWSNLKSRRGLGSRLRRRRTKRNQLTLKVDVDMFSMLSSNVVV